MPRNFRKKNVSGLYSGNAGLSRLKRRGLTRLFVVIVGSALVIGALITMVAWYAWALRPLDSNDTNHIRITIAPGTQPDGIASQLQKSHLIRSSYAFGVYTRLTRQENKLQAGTYAFAPSQSVHDIVAHLVSGKTDEFSITILPGQTLKDIRTMLESHGYSRNEIDVALNAEYQNALMASRPPGASLEGLLYPDTYNVLSDDTLQTVFARIFDHYSDVIAENNLTAGFTQQGLTLYQGITLASIIQREVSAPEDQLKVASVFYNRLDADMTLGSEVTFRYGADLLNVTPTTTLDTPYNLYIHKFLTPTPISSPELSALKAAAYPPKTDFFYFLSGDDDVTYFSKTSAEHEANIKAHCQIKCQ